MRKALKVGGGVVVAAGLLFAGGYYVLPSHFMGMGSASAVPTAQATVPAPNTTTNPPKKVQPSAQQTQPTAAQTTTTDDLDPEKMKEAEQQAIAQHAAYVKSLATAPGKQIAAFSTSLAGHNATGRVENIELAAKKISGTILLPGDVFSFNHTTGDSNNPANGWQLATVIVGKEFQQGYGGGICQVSSTMYNSVLEAGLDVVERYSHSLPVGYVAPGHDATVSYPELDFKFRNSLHMPVRIEVNVANGRVYCQLYELPAETIGL